MLKYLFISLAFFPVLLVFNSCDNASKSNSRKGSSFISDEKAFPGDKESALEIPPPPAPYTGPKKFCFEMEQGGNATDMARMQFILEDNDSIKGRLDYSFTDRESTHGTIEGVIQGNFAELIYAYTDSGIHKKEQLTFKWEGNNLFKKTGPMVEDNGVLVLENPLKAKLLLFLMQVDCK